MKKVTEATQPHHELGEPFCKLISASLLQYDESSTKHVANYFIKKERKNIALELAQEQVLKKAEYRKKNKEFYAIR